jgi:ferredoxin
MSTLTILFLLVAVICSVISFQMGVNSRIGALTRSPSSTSLKGMGDMFKKAFANEPMAPPVNAGLSREPTPVTVQFVGGKTVQALPGQRLSLIAKSAGAKIAYNCREGDCGTCAVKINGKKVNTCQTSLPVQPTTKPYVVEILGKGRK